MLLFAKSSGEKTLSKTKKSRPHYPAMTIIGIYGPLNLKQIIALARQEDKELIVMGKHSPAFQNSDLLLQEALKFINDKSLALVSEKLSDEVDPVFLDPLVIVRRSFLLEAALGLKVRSLGQLAIQLTSAASKRNLKIAYI